MKLKFSLVFMLPLLAAFSAGAQQRFTEGTVSYLVRIEQKNAGQGSQAVTGTFQLTLKDKQYIQELRLSSGFRNLIIFNAADNAAYSLRRVQDKKYAIQLDAEELRKKQSCTSFSMEDMPADGAIIAGFSSERKRIRCGKMEPIILYYSRQWEMPDPYLFQYFPGFSHLPLRYNIRNEDGSILHFELQKIEAKPIDNGAFRIPRDYKLISNEEYRQISR